MTSRIWKFIFVLFLSGIAFVSIQLFFPSHFRSFSLLSVGFSFIYFWIPGLLSLLFARKEGLKLPVFKRPNRYLYLALIVPIAISLVAFFTTEIFNTGFTFSEKPLSRILFYFFNYYCSFTVIYIFFFLGEELCWRGYLWEKLKINPYKAVWLIAFLWSLWIAPSILLSIFPSLLNSYPNLLWVFALNFALTPILLYYRIRSKSILASTFFYSSLKASPMYFAMLFPNALKIRGMIFYSAIVLLLLVIYSLFLKLYSPLFWKRLSQQSSRK